MSISLPANAVGELRLYDLLGRQYGPVRFVRGTAATLPLPRLPAGVYVVRFTGTDGQTWAERLTVQWRDHCFLVKPEVTSCSLAGPDRLALSSII